MSITFTEVATTVVAIYGAVLSTLIALREWNKNRRILKVNINNGFLTYANGSLSENLQLFIFISNHGNKVVTLSSVRLVTNNGLFVHLMPPNCNVDLPHDLESGKKINCWLDFALLKKDIFSKSEDQNIKIKAIWTDQTDKEYSSSEWFKLT